MSALRRGFTYVELMAAVMLLAIAGAGTAALWSLSVRAPASKRLTEMSFTLAVRELERLKSVKYNYLIDTGTTSPTVTYYDKYGAVLGSSSGSSYKTKAFVITQDSNGDGIFDTLDTKELTVQVWDPAETKMYEQAKTLLAFGGI